METFTGKVGRFKKTIFAVMLAVVIIGGLQFPSVIIDTDPENMLDAKEPVRLNHDKLKKDFKLSDIIVVGIVDEVNPNGVWRVNVLNRISKISKKILHIKGVVKADLMSLSTSDTIEVGSGMLDIHTIMKRPPKTEEQALELKKSVVSNPLLVEKMASADGKGLVIYIPIKDKSLSYQIAGEVEKIIAEVTEGKGTEQYYIAGLPVAEDTFGHDMFVQMAISAPMAGFVLMFMLWWFFRQPLFVIAPMIIAMVSVVVTMGLLIGSGYTVHIMSSMIPIFLMPIATVDAVHILSEFYDGYSRKQKVKEVIAQVMQTLFKPMLYTTLTTMIGFGSLLFTPIPPIQAFGLFVMVGVFVAWICTLFFVPAFLIAIGDKRLGKSFSGTAKNPSKTALGISLAKLGRYSLSNSKTIILASALIMAVSLWGISNIEINDNPVKWFKSGEKVRVADKAMNRHFAGTYMAFLRFDGFAESMKEPKIAKWIEGMQEHLESLPAVGKATSYIDLIKRVNWSMHDGESKYSILPDNKAEIAQYLFLFGMSGNPRDMDHFLDYGQKSSNIWLQLNNGDNKTMQSIVQSADDYITANPMPSGLSKSWAGLTYINTVWQERMVGGMINSLIGAYIMVFILMLVLFRSTVWAVLAILPLTLTIAISYGFIGIIGKDYDMPVAVLSALALGLSVDFAIHFITRYRETRKENPSMQSAMEKMFGESARALAKNGLIVSIGFTPLLFAPLVPYITVGLLLASIMVLSWATTILLLPSLINIFRIGESK